MTEEDDKPSPDRVSLVDTWRPPGGAATDPYTQKTVQRRVPSAILRAAREQGIYSDQATLPAAPPAETAGFDLYEEPTHIDDDSPTAQHRIDSQAAPGAEVGPLTGGEVHLLESVDQGWDADEETNDN